MKDNNLVYIILSQVIIFFIGFIKLPIYSHIFSPSELGNYFLVTSSLNYIDIILLSWVSSSFWRFIYDSDSKKNTTHLLSSFFPLLIILFIIGFIIVFLLATFVFQFNESFSLLILGFISIVLQQLTSLFYMMLQSKNQIKKWCISLILQSAFSLTLFIFLVIFWKQDLRSIFISTIIINIFLLIIGFRLLPISFTNALNSWKKDTYPRKLLTYSIQSTIVNVLLVVLINADRFIISDYKGSRLTGIYSQIYSVAFVGFSFIIQAFTNVVLPYFNKAIMCTTNKPNDSYIIKLYLLIFTPACIFLLFNSKGIIYILLSAPYHRDYQIFSWVVAGIYFYGLANFYEIRLKLLNRINLVICLLIMIAILNLTSNFYLLKNQGIEWAAINTFLSYTVMLCLMLFLNRSVLMKINFKHEAIWLFLTTLLLFIFPYCLRLALPDSSITFNLIISAILLFFTYFILYNKLKSVFLYCIKMVQEKTL